MFKSIVATFKRKNQTYRHLDVPIQISIAKNKTELTEGFKVLFESRKNESWSPSDFKGMRVGPHHLLPTTVLIIAKALSSAGSEKPSEKVVGALSLVSQGAFGIPGFDGDLSSFKRYGEIADLGVLGEQGADQETIKTELLRYACGYALNFAKLDTLFLEYPEAKEQIKGSKKNLAIWRSEEFKKQSNVVSSKVTPIWPKRNFETIIDPVLDLPLIEFFYATRSPMFDIFTVKQKHSALLIFKGSTYFERIREILNLKNTPEFSLQRASPRFETILYGNVIGTQNHSENVKITHVSRKGLAIEFLNDCNLIYFKSIQDIKIQLKEDQWCYLKVRPASFQNFKSQERGLEIIDADKMWFDFIEFLNGSLFPETASA